MPTRSDRKSVQRIRWELPYGNFPSTAPTHTDTYVQSFDNELVVSSNNGRRVRRGLGFRAGDVGGEFYVRKRRYEEYSTLGPGPMHFSTTSNPMSSGGPHYWTPQYAYRDGFNNGHFPMPTPSTRVVMNALGTFAIARTAPTKPEADLATFIGEAREGFPAAVGLSLTGKARARVARNAGDEYLNIEFGWKPLLRDVRSFAAAVKNSEEILSSYRRKSGVLLRRRYAWPVESTHSVSDLGLRQPQPLLAGALYGAGQTGRVQLTLKSETERWFTCTYMYSVPDRTLPERWKTDANKLLGANLTPNMLWNIAPWSWAADWVGNVGDVAANLSYLSTDNLVLPWCYVMERKLLSEEYQLTTGQGHYKSYPSSNVFRQTFIGETKQRIAGTPYGFGLSWDGFSKKQLAILGSLGISKFAK